MLPGSDQGDHRNYHIILAVLDYLNEDSLAVFPLEQLGDMSEDMSMSLPVPAGDQESLEAENAFITAKAVIL
jgi:hypothetical protein